MSSTADSADVISTANSTISAVDFSTKNPLSLLLSSRHNPALTPLENDILTRLQTAIQERNSDRSLANSLVSLISHALQVPLPLFKKIFDDFKSEVEDAKLRKDFAEVVMMEQVVGLLGRADAVLSFKEKEVRYFSKRNSLGSLPLEPLQSFYCPITKDVMEDPVETSSGHTFERDAIEKWFADGGVNCPMTMMPLDRSFLRPNITLRKSIEEWKERNTMITIASIKTSLGSGSEEEVVRNLGELQELCEVKESNRDCVVMENYLPILVGLLGRGGAPVRKIALYLLCLLAKDSDSNKAKIGEIDSAINCIVKSLARRTEEQKLAVVLLLELSKISTICSHIGKVKGGILLLVTISNSDNSQAASAARELLVNLSFLDDNIVQMAQANYFKPLLHRLSTGTDEVKSTMARTLAELELTDHSKASLFEDGALHPLLCLVLSSQGDIKLMAVKALLNLSTLYKNCLQMIREGAVPPLLQLLFQITSSPNIREQVAATIMNIAVAATALEADEALEILKSDDEISRLFSLVILTGPSIQQSVLRTFYALCRSPSAKNMITKLRQCSAIQVLVPLCDHSNLLLRANAVKLLFCLIRDEDSSFSTEHAGQRCLETFLAIINKSNDEEEVAAAFGVISSLPEENTQITQWLLDAGIIPVFVRSLKDARLRSSSSQLIENVLASLCRFTVSTNQESQKRVAEADLIPSLVQFLGSGTALAKRYAAISLRQLSESSLSLSKPVERRRKLFCFASSPGMLCPVHMGACSVETSFCLLESDAVVPLLRALGDQDSSVSEAALSALSTLIDGERLQSGSKVLAEANGIVPIIKLLSSQSTQLQEKSLQILERIFRLEEYKRIHGPMAQMPLVDITQRGNGSSRALAARILAHLNVLQNQSTYF